MYSLWKQDFVNQTTKPWLYIIERRASCIQITQLLLYSVHHYYLSASEKKVVNQLGWHSWEVGKSLIFQRKTLEYPTLPLISKRADLSELFAQMFSALEAVVLGGATFPSFL